MNLDRRTMKHDGAAAAVGAAAVTIAWVQAPWWAWTLAGAAAAIPARRSLGKRASVKAVVKPARQAVRKVVPPPAARSIKADWLDILPADYLKGDEHPTCDKVTESDDVIELEVTLTRQMIKPAQWRAFAETLMHALRGVEVDYKVHPADTRDRTKPARLTIKIYLKGIPEKVTWQSVPELVNGYGFPLGTGSAGRSFVWATPNLDVAGKPGRGKSACLALILWTALHDRTVHPDGWRVILIDGKGGTKEFYGLTKVGVEVVTGAREQNLVLVDLEKHYEECAHLVDQYGSWRRIPDQERPKPVLVIIDEYSRWAGAPNEQRKKGVAALGQVMRLCREFDGRVVRASQEWSVATNGGDGSGALREFTAGVSIGHVSPTYAGMVLGVQPSEDDFALLPDRHGAALVRGLREGETRVEQCQLAYLDEAARVPLSTPGVAS